MRMGTQSQRSLSTHRKTFWKLSKESLYPALHRLEDRGWVSSYWGASENNRKAKFYRLTAAGRKQLVRETSRWRQMTRAIGLVMGE
jgi:PadR family transcriptional regulator PadR